MLEGTDGKTVVAATVDVRVDLGLEGRAKIIDQLKKVFTTTGVTMTEIAEERTGIAPPQARQDVEGCPRTKAKRWDQCRDEALIQDRVAATRELP